MEIGFWVYTVGVEPGAICKEFTEGRLAIGAAGLGFGYEMGVFGRCWGERQRQLEGAECPLVVRQGKDAYTVRVASRWALGGGTPADSADGNRVRTTVMTPPQHGQARVGRGLSGATSGTNFSST